MKICSTSLVIKEIQIKNHDEIPPHTCQDAKIHNSGNNRCWQGCRERGTLFALLVGMQAGAATLENNMEVTQKIKNRPSNCTTIYTNDTKMLIGRGTCTPMFTAPLSTAIFQIMERAQMPID